LVKQLATINHIVKFIISRDDKLDTQIFYDSTSFKELDNQKAEITLIIHKEISKLPADGIVIM